MGAGVALATVGLSLAGSLAPAVASADPWVPFSGSLHPARHYAADILHPFWALTRLVLRIGPSGRLLEHPHVVE